MLEEIFFFLISCFYCSQTNYLQYNVRLLPLCHQRREDILHQVEHRQRPKMKNKRKHNHINNNLNLNIIQSTVLFLPHLYLTLPCVNTNKPRAIEINAKIHFIVLLRVFFEFTMSTDTKI